MRIRLGQRDGAGTKDEDVAVLKYSSFDQMSMDAVLVSTIGIGEDAPCGRGDIQRVPLVR